MTPDFSQLVWTAPGTFRVGSELFKVQSLGAELETASDGFVIYKEPKHFEIYSSWWPAKFAPSEMLELGIWAGGSAVFWNELLCPKRLGALDIKKPEFLGTDNLARLEAYQKRQPGLRLYWSTSQADAVALGRILDEDFPAGIDFVIDDASHLYGLSRSSFEIIFPRVRAGGWYVIEDWPWDVADPFPGQEYLLRSGPPLSLLITDLALITGRDKNVIDAVEVIRTLTFIQRGSAALKPGFSIADYLPNPKLKDVRRVARRFLSHFCGRRGW